MEESLKSILNRLWADAKQTESSVRRLMESSEFHDPEWRDDKNKAEVRANIMLAVRHLEYARMRLGKAIQYRDGGVSIYDRKEG